MELIQDNKLIDAASDARRLAYAPYSGFQVGAALATSAGKIYTGCNVENVSLGLTICAERSAIATAIAQGDKDFVAIAVVTAGKKPAVPCGACRQVMAEFNPSMKIIAATVDGKVQEFDLAELLPFPSQGILEGSRDV
ncbi:MAG TPA: cytidine deaminase [Chthoniobacterales bacterium]|nr:cytidine deaminase [Chthoniobacterales bacterium]